jgi:hypothetical protein
VSRSAAGFRCDACGKTRESLSESWSTVTVLEYAGLPTAVLHHCLECRSIKREWR